MAHERRYLAFKWHSNRQSGNFFKQGFKCRWRDSVDTA